MRSRIIKYVPGSRLGQSPWVAVVFSLYFYLYLAIFLARGAVWADLFRSPSVGSVCGGIAAVIGLVFFYAAAVVPGFVDERPSGRVFADRSRRFWTHKPAVAGLAIFLLFIGVSFLAPLVTPCDPAVQTEPALQRYQAPSSSHLMGTDKFGRDVFSRVIYGTRVSLAIGLFAVLLASVIGTLFGAFSGYLGGRVDDIAMRLVDGLLAFPRLLLLLTLVAFFANSFGLVILVLAGTGWMGVARLVRADVLSLKERDFIQAAVASGIGHGRIVWRHLIPNALGTVVVAATLRFAVIVLLESYLSFLGLGVQPPTPSWGSMVFEGREVLLSAWWVSAFPGLAIVGAVVSCNLLGDGLRDAMDVRMG
jgi:peptide/nickel transport system permease protein